MAQSKTTHTANWHTKCCSGQPNTSLPWRVPRQAQRAIHQLRLNRLTSTASYQAFIGWIMSLICPHCGSGRRVETTEHLPLPWPRWAAEYQRHFGDSTYWPGQLRGTGARVPLNFQLFNLSGHFRAAQSLKLVFIWLPTQKKIYRLCHCSLHKFHNILCVTLKFF